MVIAGLVDRFVEGGRGCHCRRRGGGGRRRHLGGGGRRDGRRGGDGGGGGSGRSGQALVVEGGHLLVEVLADRHDVVLGLAVGDLALGAADVVLELIAVGVEVRVGVGRRIPARDVQ